MPHLHTWQPLTMCRQNSVRGRPENSLHQERTHAEWGLWGLVVVRLSWLSGRALAAQARGVLGSTPGDCRPFHFPLFSPHNNLNSFMAYSVLANLLKEKILTFFLPAQWAELSPENLVELVLMGSGLQISWKLAVVSTPPGLLLDRRRLRKEASRSSRDRG